MRKILRLASLTLCLLAAGKAPIALADDNAPPTCPPGSEYVAEAIHSNPDSTLPSLYSEVSSAFLSTDIQIRTDTGWLLTIKQVYPDLDTPIKTIRDISQAMDSAEIKVIKSIHLVGKGTSENVAMLGKPPRWRCTYGVQGAKTIAYADYTGTSQ